MMLGNSRLFIRRSNRFRFTIILLPSILLLGSGANECFSQSGWLQLNSGTTQSLKGVFFPNFNTGCICTDAGNILRTTNAGVNWSSQQIYTQILAAIQFTDQLTGYTVSSADGTVLKTTNSGVNWFIPEPSTGSNMYTLHFPSSLTGYTGGIGGRIKKTTNAGSNWATVYYPMTSYIYSIFFPNDNTGYAAFFNGNLVKTTNGGLNWTNILSLTQQFLTVYFLDINTGWIGGNNGFLEKTTNGGASWVSQNSATGGAIWSIYFVNLNTGYACGGNQPSTLSFITKTTNQGINWSSQSRPVSYALYSIFFTDSLTGYAVGYNGTILKTTTGGVTYIQPISNEIPNQFSLSQNFPNPFNPTTNVQFSIINVQYVTLKVYDLLGREVATLVNEQLKPGTYEADWDGSGFASGVYYYKLIADEYTETRKMVLMK